MKHFEIYYDTAFSDVIRECGTISRTGQQGSWIIPEVVEAYTVLFDMGYAHSIEAWQDGELVGGLYGVAIGKMFFGESMFSKVKDASKVAFASLIDRLKKEGFDMIDCQIPSEHLRSLGAREISRAEFMKHLKIQMSRKLTQKHWN